MGGFPRPLGREGLVEDGLCDGRVLLEIGGKPLVDHLAHQRLGLGVAELGLGLALELTFGELDADDRGDALPDVVAGQVLVVFLEQFLCMAVVVEHPGQRQLEAGLVGAAVHRMDVVGKTLDHFRIAVVILDRYLGQQAPVQPGQVDRRGVQRSLGLV